MEEVKLSLLEAEPNPGSDEHSVDGDVHWKEIGVSVGVAVHGTNDALPRADQKTSGSVDVVSPPGKRFKPDWDHWKLQKRH